VTFAGGDPCCQYGYHVIIEHGEGSSSLYGHLSQIYVSEGQYVSQGDVLGLGGATGEADGKHLHFELRLGGELVDPLRVLPSVQRSAWSAGGELTGCPSSPIAVAAASFLTLTFTSNLATRYVVDGVDLWLLTGPSGAPVLDAQPDGSRSVVVYVPPAPAATGQTVRYQLETRLSDGDSQRVVACQLELATMQTLPNPEKPAARTAAPPTPTPTPTIGLRQSPTPYVAPTRESVREPTRTPAPSENEVRPSAPTRTAPR
jgi:pyruvate/2-oxoglutarate dehydrogenase complex dihydrolipoamide acyltransferase (E2) component